MTRNDASWTLRAVTPADDAVLFEIYASARRDELAQVPWDDAQKRAFLTFQFDAQHRHYRQAFADADFCLVLCDGQPAGRLYVDRRADEIRILDVALLPAFQGRGLGRAVLADLLQEARTAGKPVRLYVEAYQHRARSLLASLGFEVVEQHGLSALMAWTP